MNTREKVIISYKRPKGISSKHYDVFRELKFSFGKKEVKVGSVM